MSLECDIGVIGLAVMGQNLILNMNDKGFSVAVYNRSASRTEQFLSSGARGRSDIVASYSIEEFCSLLSSPRKIMLMVKAGEAVDDFIQQLLPHLSAGDIIIDGGNSFYVDTIRRTEYLAGKEILFIGSGISGGEEGARHGPSIMPGGNSHAWDQVKKIFSSICARTPQGELCCDWVGPDGAGHYVKMIHNGIEYGDMQLISEAYSLLKNVVGLNHQQMGEVFRNWNSTELKSYLIEITADIMNYKDIDNSPLLTKILDVATQKGTGKWTGINSFELGVPVTLISEAVYARAVSELKEERSVASGQFSNPGFKYSEEKDELVEHIREALLASKIISYAQGFMLLRAASEHYSWNLDYGKIALLWREGCIIRSVFLDKIKQAFVNSPDLKNLILDPYFKTIIESTQASWRKVVSVAVQAGISVPAFSTALSFFDGYRTPNSAANLIQAQRDYFGAHTYKRNDRPGDQFFHTNWSGRGGEATSGSGLV
ncbi:6-phosphogluconate dehydrogenase, decarboxylating [Chitinispirillum alkaliphilum]|nr:6-phosphogluconate dehydrogenase, decarboxylating [Chitinispirillum alkaliphilum]